MRLNMACYNISINLYINDRACAAQSEKTVLLKAESTIEQYLFWSVLSCLCPNAETGSHRPPCSSVQVTQGTKGHIDHGL